MKVKRLGEILREEGMITDLQLMEALQLQKEERRRIGDVLVDLKYVTKRQLRYTIEKYKKRIPLGEYLLEKGTITADDLEFALSKKASAHRRLGETLVETRIISEEQLAQALSQQLDMPYIVPYLRMVDLHVFSRLPPSFIRHNRIVPLTQSDGVTTVVVSGAIDEATSFHLEKVFGSNIELAICAPSKIDEIITGMLESQGTTEVPEIRAEETRLSAEGITRMDMSGERIRAEGSETQAVDLVNYVINEAIRESASDIHLDSMPDRVRVRFRVDGLLTHKTDLPIGSRDALFRRIKVLSNLDVAETHKEQEGRLMGYLDEKKIDMRVSIFIGIHGESVSMRLFRQDLGMMDVEDLGMTPNAFSMCRRALDYASGMIAFTGVPASGKTTSLYAALNYLNSPEISIVSVENPVEYMVEGAVQGQLSSHRDSTLGDVIRTAIHQDPDVIVVGEVLDAGQTKEVIAAALTGHKVLTTFNADDTVGAVQRLLDAGGVAFFRSSSALTVVCQRLVRKICPKCRQGVVPETELLQQFPIKDFDPDKYDFYEGKGCAACHNSGFAGRTGFFEVLTINDALREAFLKGSASAEVLSIARATTPFLTINEVGMLKAIRGVTTVEEVLRVAPLVSRDREMRHPLTVQEIERISEGSFFVE